MEFHKIRLFKNVRGKSSCYGVVEFKDEELMKSTEEQGWAIIFTGRLTSFDEL